MPPPKIERYLIGSGTTRQSVNFYLPGGKNIDSRFFS